MKKIIIDAFQHSESITGTDRFAANVLVELQKIDEENKYRVLCSRYKYVRSHISSRNFHVVMCPRICSLPIIGRYLTYLWRRYNKLTLLMWRADVFFSFHNMSLPGRRLARKMISSNLDLIPLALDEYKDLGRTSYAEKKNAYERVAKMADKFISISEHSKKELHRMLGVPNDKIEVIKLAADPMFQSANHQTSSNYSKPYILTIGGSEPRKNVNLVIKAYDRLPDSLQKKYSLIIAGGEWHSKKLRGVNGENIISAGYVPDHELVNLYLNSEAFVFASTYEGFGFALLEAMSLGTPIIRAKGTSLDEVSGEATLSFSPEDENELAQKIEALLTNKKLRQDLIDKGLQQASKFSWSKTAKRIHEVLLEN